MTIQLDSISVIIPIPLLWKCPEIEDVERFLADQTGFGGRYRRDAHLYRDGAMNTVDIELILSAWQKAGLRLMRRRGGVDEWCDLCVVDMGGPTLPCRWLKHDAETHKVELERAGLQECLGGFGR